MTKWHAKKRTVSAVALGVAIVGVLTVTAVAQSQRFPDVPPDHEAFEAVEWAAEAGVTTGYTDGTFKPERPLLKDHAVIFIERYYDQILQASESEDFTRGDMMVLLKAINDGTLRDADAPGDTASGASGAAQGQRFPDVAMDHYAFDAVEWAAEAGVTVGYGDGTFKPQRPLIKDHAVIFMERYYDEILRAEESEDFTRGDMMVLLKAINDGTAREPPGACGGSSEDDAVQWVGSNAAKDVSWSPDCTQVAFVHYGDLWLMTNRGHSPRLVVDDEHAWLLTPAWSPDGARIAYGRQYVALRDDEEHEGVLVSHIWSVSPDGREARQLTDGDTVDLWPAWSPDGSRIAFSREVEGDRFIVVMDSDGTRQQPLTAGGLWEQTPAWSPDGARIAYIAGDEVIVANADATGARAAFGGVAPLGGLSWSPDGSRVAFVRDGGTGSALHVSTLDGTGERVIAESDGKVLIPQWSPDGQRIAFHIRSDTAERLYVGGIDSSGFIEAEPTRTIPPAGTAPVTEPPAALGLDPFYTKHIDADLPVVGSSEVSDEALRRAALVFGQIVANRPDIVQVLAQHRVRVAVYAVTEEIVDLPEVAETFPDLDPGSVGLGPGPGFPVVATSEANLLCDGYSSVTVHEGGHAVDYALSLLGDDAFQNRLDAAYDKAMAQGLWEGSYATTNAAEYWAEGVLWFMNASDERDIPHPGVNTRDELQDYDPVLHELVLDVLGDVEATASCYGKQ